MAGLKESFTYDGLQRLSGASRYASLTATTPAETQTFTYDPTGNLLGKGSQYTGYSYTATTGCTNPHAQPHAVRQVTAGGSPRSYCYDANGNLTTISGTNAGYTAVSWWAANLARRMSKGSTSAEFWYGPDRARVLQVATRATETERTVYLGSLYERTVITPNTTGSATTRHVHYVRAGDETVAIKTWSKVGTGAYTPQVRYPHRDHLGSVVAITTETGTVESRSSFDVWGKRRDPATWVTPAPGTFTAAPTATDRGYTGHENIDELGLVHMNGRIYDPEIGKFLSADPTLQFPESTQGYNRYAYAGNNPLTFTDPSGFSFWKKLLSVVGVLLNFIPGFQGWSTAFWQGFITGFLTSGGNLKAALLGGVGGALFGVVGGKTMSFVQRALLHGLIGGSISALGGGRFGSGFLGAFASGLLSPQIEGLLGAAGTGGIMGTVLRTVASAIVGGISSKLGGGKFLNGAAMAAFARLFNDEAHTEKRSDSSAQNDMEEEVVVKAKTSLWRRFTSWTAETMRTWATWISDQVQGIGDIISEWKSPGIGAGAEATTRVGGAAISAGAAALDPQAVNAAAVMKLNNQLESCVNAGVCQVPEDQIAVRQFMSGSQANYAGAFNYLQSRGWNTVKNEPEY